MKVGDTVVVDGVIYVVDRVHPHVNKVGLTAKHITKFKTVDIDRIA
jgi:hypothetical protein